MRIVRSVVACCALVAATLAVLAQPVSATELGNRDVVKNTDFAVFGVGGMRGTGNGTIAVTGVSGTVTKALLYWNGPTNGGSTVNAAVTFNGHDISGANVGTSSDNCWGFGNSQSYRADVSPYVSGNGNYALAGFRKTTFNSETNSTTVDADINGVSLLVFFDDGTSGNNRDVTFVDGNDSNKTNTYDSDGWDSTIQNVDVASGTAKLWTVVSDGQSYPEAAFSVNGKTLVDADNTGTDGKFDGTSVPGTLPPTEVYSGNLWDVHSFDISPAMASETNDLRLTMPYLDDCLSLVTAAVTVPTAYADLSITKIDSPDPVKAGNVLSYTIDVHNGGGAAVTGAAVQDTFPLTLSNVTWSCTVTGAGACGASSGSENIDTTVNLANGSTAEFFVTATVDPAASGPISNTATVSSPADSTPGNNSATATTTIISGSTKDVAAGFCTGATDCTISTDPGTGATATDPVVSMLTVPAGADPQAISMREDPVSQFPTLCGGTKCNGQVLTFSSSTAHTLSGVTDPNHPAVLVMIFDKTVKQGTQIYVKKGAAAPKLVANCTTTGVASPHPCVSEKNILLPNGDREFKILFLQDDPTLGKR